MKNKKVYRRMDNEIVFLKDTDFPPLTSRQFHIIGVIQETIEKKQSNILSMKEIFKGFTFSKRQRFLIISSLIKSNILKRTKVDYIYYEYEIIPKTCWRKCSEMRIYKTNSKKERLELMKELKSI